MDAFTLIIAKGLSRVTFTVTSEVPTWKSAALSPLGRPTPSPTFRYQEVDEAVAPEGHLESSRDRGGTARVTDVATVD